MEEGKKKGKKKGLIILLVIIILLIIAAGVYFIFGKKTINSVTGKKEDFYSASHKTDKGNTFQIFTDSEELKNVAKKAYRDKYLKICLEKKDYVVYNGSLVSTEKCTEAQNDTLSFNEYASIISLNAIKLFDNDRVTRGEGYGSKNITEFIKLNDKVIAVYDKKINNNYGVYAGNDVENDPKWPYEYYFLINYNTGEVIEYDKEISIVDKKRYEYDLPENDDVTYFTIREKDTSEFDVYTTEWKYLGKILTKTYSMVDSDGNVYVTNDNIISKFNAKGEKISSLPNMGDIVDFTVYKDVCLALYFDEKEQLYLYDDSVNKTIKTEIVNAYGEKGYVTNKEIAEYIYFHYHNFYFSDSMDREIAIHMAATKKNAGTYSSDIAYEFDTKVLKQIPESTIYKNDKVTIELLEDIYADNDNENIKKYEVFSNNKFFKAEGEISDINDNLFVIKNKNRVYLLNSETKEIVTYYIASKQADYNITDEYYNNDKNTEKWFFIYDGNMNDNGKIVVIANQSYGEIIREDKGKIINILINNNELYLAYDKKIVKYSSAGKELKTITYDKIFDKYAGSIYQLYTAYIQKGNSYYVIDFEKSDNEVLLEKVISYNNDKETIDIYKANGNEYLFDGKYFDEISSDENYKADDENYLVYPYEDGSMCLQTVLVNKKTNKIEAHGESYNFIKTKSGYFFTHSDCIGLDAPDIVYTTEWKKLGLLVLDDPISEDGIYVYKDNHLIEVNANGEELKKSKEYNVYDVINGVKYNGKIYVITHDNKDAYIVTLDSDLNELAQLKIGSKDNNYYMYNGDNEITLEVYREDSDSKYKYDINNNKLIEIKED